jgi:hypothetical protein
MKEYECVEVKHRKEIARVIQEYIMKGWHLHTYQATCILQVPLKEVAHYLLFERG